MTVITGETGAGKTLLVDALELLCGGRADPSSVREGATEARRRRPLRRPRRTTRVVLARVVPVVGRSRGYVDGRLATVGRARRARAAPRRPARAARTPVAARTRGAARAARPIRAVQPRRPPARELARARGRRAGDVEDGARRGWAATSAPGRARSTCCATSSTEIDAARHRRRRRGRAARGARRRSSPTPRRTARRSPPRTRRSKARRRTRWARRSPRSPAARRSPSSPTGCAHCRSRSPRPRATSRVDRRVGRRRSRAAGRRCSNAARGSTSLTRKYGADAGRSRSPTRARSAPGSPSSNSTTPRAAALEAERRGRARPRRTRPRRRSRRRAARPPDRSRDAVTEQLRDARDAEGGLRRSSVEPRPSSSDDGADDVTFLLAPNPGRAAAAAGPGRVRRRALARDAGAPRRARRRRRRRWCSTRSTPGIGGEAGSAVGRALAAARRSTPGALRDAPCRRSRRSPTRTSRSSKDGSGADARCAARRCCSTTRAGRRARRACSPAICDSAHARRHARRAARTRPASDAGRSRAR